MELSGALSTPLEASRPDPPAAGGGDPLARVFLAAAVLLGLLRFVALGRWSLWLDEAFTLADAPHAGEHPINPLGYWLFDVFYGFAGDRPDEWWMRLPAAVCGLGSILATAWALRPFVGARAASLGAFFVSASAWHLYWSQNARFYTLAQLLALLGGGLLLRGLYGASHRRTLLGLALLAAAPLAHPSAALLGAPLLFLPWIARWLEWVPEEAAEDRSWSTLSTASFVAILIGLGWAIRVFMTHDSQKGAGDPLHFVKTSGYLITPTLGLACAAGLWRSRRQREVFVPLYATALLFLAAGLVSCFARVSAQYVFVALPWVAAVAGLAFVPGAGEAEPPGLRRKRALLALAVALPGLVETGLYFGPRQGDRWRWREAYAYVFEHRAPDDLVLGMDAPVAEYYLQPGSTDLRQWTSVTWLDTYRAKLAGEWSRYRRPTWLVVNDELMNDWKPEDRAEVRRFLDEDCTLEADFPVPLTPRDLDVRVYVTRP